MKRSKTRAGSILLGVIVAVSVILSQCFSLVESKHFETSSSKIEQGTEDTNEASNNLVSFVLSSSSLPSPVQIHLNQETVFLFEIVFERKEMDDCFYNPPLPFNQFFQILLGVTITPNAP